MILRPFNEGDALTWWNWYHDKRLANYFRGYIYGVSVEQCKQAPEMMRGHILLGVDEEYGNLLGAVNFCDTNSQLRIYKMGLLVDPNIQNNGIGKELSEKAINWAFNTMNAHKIICDVVADDARMLKGLEAAGFEQYGHDVESLFVNGEIKDELKFHLLRRNYGRLFHGDPSTGSGGATPIAARDDT